MKSFTIFPQITTRLGYPMEGEEFLVGVREEIQKQMIKDWINWRTKNPIEIVEEWSGYEDHYPAIYVTIAGDEEIEILPHRQGLTQTWKGIKYNVRMEQDIVWWDE